MFQQIIDTIFDPVIRILITARDNLDAATLTASQGLNLDYYLGPISMLGWQWRTLVATIVASAFLILCVLVGRKVYGLYMSIKDGVKWW